MTHFSAIINKKYASEMVCFPFAYVSLMLKEVKSARSSAINFICV